MKWPQINQLAKCTVIFLIMYAIVYTFVYEEICSSQEIVSKLAYGRNESNTSTLFGYEKSTLRNEEWEQVNAYTFIRREAAYYLVNQNTLTYMFVRKNVGDSLYVKMTTMLLIQYGDKVYNITHFNHPSLTQIVCHYYYCLERYSFREFNLATEMLVRLGVKLDTSKPLSEQPIKLAFMMRYGKASIRPEDAYYVTSTQYPIEVKIREWKEDSRKGIVVCSGSINYGQSNYSKQYEQLNWWIELNKAFGYRKLSLTSNNIPNTNEFQQLFNKHKDFLDVYRINWLPNFFHDELNLTVSHHNNSYFNNFKAFYGHNIGRHECNVFKTLIYNECLMDSIDKYEYAVVQDLDELVIPHANRIFRRDSDSYKFLREMDLSDISSQSTLIKRIEDKLGEGCGCLGNATTNEKPIDLYMKDISNGTNINNRAIYLHMGHHLTESFLNDILDAVKVYFESGEYKKKRDESQKQNSLPSTMYSVKLIGKTYDNKTFTYHLQMVGEEDVRYAKNLLKIHKLLVEDKKTRQSSALANTHTRYNTFNRFFFWNNDWLKDVWGKTIHHTGQNYPANIHIQVGNDNDKPLTLDKDLGHVSHFRDSLAWGDFNKTVANISDLKFDFNYMFCYYRKAYKSIVSSDIFQD